MKALPFFLLLFSVMSYAQARCPPYTDFSPAELRVSGVQLEPSDLLLLRKQGVNLTNAEEQYILKVKRKE